MRKKEKSTIWLIYFPLSWVTYAKPRGETAFICQSTLCFRICQEDLYHWRKIFISWQKVVNTSFPIIQNSTCWSGETKNIQSHFFYGTLHCGLLKTNTQKLYKTKWNFWYWPKIVFLVLIFFMLQSKGKHEKLYLHGVFQWTNWGQIEIHCSCQHKNRMTLFRWRTPKDDAVSLKKPNPRLPRMNDEPVWLFQLSRLSRL